MDNHLVWKEEFNIGIKIIDEEHQRLFKIINKLFALEEEEKKSKRACQEGIKYFKEHALKHFRDEEKYMELIAYGELETHRRLHRGFRESLLPALEKELEREDYSPVSVDHFLAVCAGWLIGHTLTEDLAITGEKKSKWVDLMPEEEIAAMKELILRLLKNMFQLNARVISDSYGGEKFGKGVYYRLVYGRGQDDEKWEIILVFEEKLLINTIGKIMGVKSGKLDIMLLNAARYTACQFVQHVMDYYPSIRSYEMTEENLLTYEQFQEVFENKQPQVSLLLDTDGGYFSYCVIAPHLLQHGIGTPLETDNAVSEVEKYLREREEDIKPKVLVVDDSATIRQGMKRLLEEKYEVSLVSSGVSAIRAVTLDKPDLVLLDYEMPVCDGSHVLEMLHSEEEFADIPVIFLTSRGDPESVKKVLSLKPDGYLLKYLKPLEIRKRIDDYFLGRNT
ncbi:MAG: response regulator [Lachnospiraceae bacterium]|nr:response regulator [Lachnospiraceae bacterium]MCI9082051.1 response regulator [Lachnospiraceae bacterium]MCI9183922.1 response regulator [Lachnospiraceae bacterium]